MLMEKRAPITDVNTFEVEARPPLTVIFLQQAYDMVFYEPEPVQRRTWAEQLSPPLPAVLGTGEGKGKGKDKGKVKGPLFRGGPAPGRDDEQQGYIDRWGRQRQYRYYKGGSKHSKETVQSPLPPTNLARPAGRLVSRACQLVSMCRLLWPSKGKGAGSPDKLTSAHHPYQLDQGDWGSKQTAQFTVCMVKRFVFEGTRDAAELTKKQASPLKHHGGRPWWKGDADRRGLPPRPPQGKTHPTSQ